MASEQSAKRAKADAEWAIEPSLKAQRTKNPIRRIVDKIANAPRKTDKELIPLSLGDPTVYGNLGAPEALTEAVVRAARAKKSNGYGHSAGTPACRAAVAKFMSTPAAPLTADDIILCSGGSGALELAITALANEGDNILVPAPGFPLYQVIAESNGAEVKEYPLLPERGWEIDVEALEKLIDGRTKAIMVNNPSNPCGSLFSDDNLRALLAVAERHRLPIVTDEIYGSMTFNGHPFTPIATLTDTVPVLSVGGMAKMFVVPGWRVGWIEVHDRGGKLAALRGGMMNLSQLILGAGTLVQAGLEEVLRAENEGGTELAAFNKAYVGALEAAANMSVRALAPAKGLEVIEPKGAMYLMVQVKPECFRDITDDRDFAQKLLEEEAVFVLPGSCFSAPNFFRVVFTAPEAKLAEAFERIVAFCEAHAV